MNSFLYGYLKACALKADWNLDFERALKSHLAEIFPDVNIYFEPYDRCWVIDSPSHSEPKPNRSIPFSEVWNDVVEQFPFPNNERHLFLWMPGCRNLSGFYLSNEEAQKVKSILNGIFSLPIRPVVSRRLNRKRGI
jgi:hypothetical protein